MFTDNITKHIIKSNEQLAMLVKKVKTEKIADFFQFENEELRDKFIKLVIPKVKSFEEEKFYYDDSTNTHICESRDGYFWISTIGLIANSKFSDNNYVNAFEAQKLVLLSLIESVNNNIKLEAIYDIDNIFYENLKIYTLALWQNVVFFYELFGKAYLSIKGKEVKHTHSISEITEDVKSTMKEIPEKESKCQEIILENLDLLSNYINNIPGKFCEPYIKYDDNENDSTCFPFSDQNISQLQNIVLLFGNYLYS